MPSIENFTEYLDDWDNGGQKEIQYKKTDIALSPNLVGGAVFTLVPVKQLNIDLISKYVGDQFLDNTSNEKRKLDAYYTQDLRLMYSFRKAWLKNVSLIFQLNNVFDEKYEPNGYTYSYYENGEQSTTNNYFPMAGRNWVMGVNVRL